MSVMDTYLANVPEPQRVELERIRWTVQKLAPNAEEVISYGMPGFRYKQQYLLGFNAFKDHISLFPTGAPITAFQDRLAGFKFSKGAIQFTPEHPLPNILLEEIISYRIMSLK
jgi:uncharacterized protein YdhG (YjbR/CyaY superfamily)